MPVRLNIEAFVSDYCNGVPDRDLLARHRISAKEMISVVKRLIQEGQITKDQYFGRTRKIQEIEARQEKDFLQSLYHCPICSHLQPTPFTRCPACGHEISEHHTVGESGMHSTVPPDVHYDGEPEPTEKAVAAVESAVEEPPSLVSVTPVEVPSEKPEDVPEVFERLIELPLESVSLLPESPEDIASEDFEITEIIAAGVQSAMFKAEPISGSRPPIAVKVFDPDLLPKADLEDALSRIITYQSAMNDENIITIFGSGSVGGNTAIIYEYLPLNFDMMMSSAPDGMPLELLMSLLPQILNAIGYSHMHRGKDGIIRRLPHLNLRLSRFFYDGEKGRVKLEGCGVWKSLVETRKHKRRLWEEPGVDISALAPEAFVLNSRFVNPFLADVYALGTVIYRLATGHPAFSAGDVKDYGFVHLRKFPIPPRVHRYQLPNWLDAMILKCLEKEPENRWRSATQMELGIAKDFSP